MIISMLITTVLNTPLCPPSPIFDDKSKLCLVTKTKIGLLCQAIIRGFKVFPLLNGNKGSNLNLWRGKKGKKIAKLSGTQKPGSNHY